MGGKSIASLVELSGRWLGGRMEVYKFLKSRWADEMVSKGSVKIGTSSEYRVDDGKVGGQYDPRDSTYWFQPGDVTVLMTDGSGLARRLAPGVKIREGGIPITFTKDSVINFSTLAMIYSCSCNFSDELAATMAAKFSADACVKIIDAEAFGTIVSQMGPPNGRHFSARPVTYKPHEMMTIDEVGDGGEVFVKRPEFKWQDEFRFVWNILPGRDGPWFIELPEIKPLLTRIF